MNRKGQTGVHYPPRVWLVAYAMIGVAVVVGLAAVPFYLAAMVWNSK